MTFSEVLAPVLPFITERIYRTLVVSCDASSVPSIHLRDFPAPRTGLIDDGLEEGMALARTVVRLAHALRKRHNIRVRQPLSALTVNLAAQHRTETLEALSELVRGEVNVRRLRVLSGEQAAVELSAKADFRSLGPRLGARTPQVAQAIERLGRVDIQRLLDGETIEVAGTEITGEDVVVRRTAPEGTATAVEQDLTVTLDIDLTEELITEGVAREVTARLQQHRRESNLQVTDRISLTWESGHPAVAKAMETHGQMIADELLATEWQRGPGETSLAVGDYPLSVTMKAVPVPSTGGDG